jgi:hypothetical protein
VAAYIGSVLVGVYVALFGSLTSASTNNAFPEDGVTAPKHVSYFNVNFNIVFANYIQNVIQHLAVKVNSICREN